MVLRFRVAAAVVAAVLLAPMSALAQAYPAKPVRVIVVFPPGGSNDVVARIVFGKMNELMNQTFVIDNRGGGAGSLGASVVAQSPADGYTLMVHSTTHVANAHVFGKKLPYDTMRAFIGITPLARQVAIAVVHPSLPVRSIRELIDLAKKRPGEVVFGSAGHGSYIHLTVELLTSMTGTKMLHVPYKGGGPALAALVSGETQLQIGTIASVLTQMKAGRVRPLGVTSDKRTKQFPDVPAIAETVPGYEFTAWIGAFAPAGTPRPVIDRLNAELRRAVSDPEISAKLDSMTLDPMHMTPEQFATRLQSDYERYGKMLRDLGTKVD
ncbi:MAG: tripartite tricarboxylate transporter substrate binding protein [Betaproteobacteria bacterium]|nr:tripartite tricarboxylate transporter substrate binding protein [Betaproteobacteria bacterium]